MNILKINHIINFKRMDLQNFIDSSKDYISSLKSDGFIIKTFSKYSLYLLKYPYDKEIDPTTYERYCRGALVHMDTKRVLFVPPVKASQTTFIESENIQELYDGTMINMFFHNNEWILTTRSDVGLKNKWGEKSFKTLFEECGGNNLYNNQLNKDYTYSFVMQHVENRNVTEILMNRLILVEVRHNLELVDLQTIPKNENYMIANYLTKENLDYYNNILTNNSFGTFGWKGFTIKQNDKRFNVINPMFENVNKLKTNSTNPLYTFCELFKSSRLQEFIHYFPDNTKLFEKYKMLTNICIKELYDNYVDIKIKKCKLLHEAPFQLKPIVYDLHGIYLKQKQKITYNVVESYCKELSAEKLTFVLKYYISL